MAATNISVQSNKRINSRSVWLLALGTLLSNTSLYAYLPTLVPYALSLGASLSLIGLISGSYGFIQILIRFPLGMLSDRWGQRKWFVLLGSMCGIVSCLGFVLSTSPWTFIVWRGLAGLGGATLAVNAALFAAHFDTTQTERAMGIFNFTTALALALGPIIGGVVAQVGWTTPFFVGGGIGLVGLTFLSGIQEPVSTGTTELSMERTFMWLLHRPRLLWSSALMAVITFTQFITVFTFVPIQAMQLGATQFELGLLMFATMGTFSTATLVSGAIVTPCVGSRTTAALGFLLVALSIIALPSINTLTLLAVDQVVGGIGWGYSVTVTANDNGIRERL